MLDRCKSRRALIGRVAMWYWLDDEADHGYTKNVDFAVPQVSIPSILEVLHQTDAEVSQLTIGGVHARISKQGFGLISSIDARDVVRLTDPTQRRARHHLLLEVAADDPGLQ